MKLLRLIWVLGALGLLALPASAWSRGLPLRVATPRKVSAPASPLTVSIRTARGARCSLRGRGGHSTLRVRAARADRRGRVGWSWLVPAKAPASRWRVSVMCAQGRRHRAASRSVIVATSGHNRYGPLVQRSTTRLLAGGLAKKRKRAPRLTARAASTASDPFQPGQCTWWAALKRPDLYPTVHGNAGDWLAEAQSGGIPTGSTPAVGAIAVFLPYVDGAGGYGHVAYVEAVNGDGTVTVSEDNYYIRLGGPDYRRVPASLVSGFIYGGPVKTPGYAPQPSAPTGYHVYGTGSKGLVEHSGPSASSSRTGTLSDGASVNIACQTQSVSVVNGSSIWDKLASGSYVSDYFVDTPDVGTFTSSIARCNVPAPAPTTTAPPGSGQYQIANAPGGVSLRSGPTTGSAADGTLPNGASITIVCQTKSDSYVNNTSNVWDLLSNNAWVSDYYTSTPTVGNFSPGLTQCGSSSGPTYVAPGGSTPQTHHVTGVGSAGLYERSGPGTNYSQVGWLANGATIEIACQIESNSAVNGSPVWDLLTDGKYVTDYYTDTPVVGNYSPGIGHCTAEPAL